MITVHADNSISIYSNISKIADLIIQPLWHDIKPSINIAHRDHVTVEINKQRTIVYVKPSITLIPNWTEDQMETFILCLGDLKYITPKEQRQHMAYFRKIYEENRFYVKSKELLKDLEGFSIKLTAEQLEHVSQRAITDPTDKISDMRHRRKQ